MVLVVLTLYFDVGLQWHRNARSSHTTAERSVRAVAVTDQVTKENHVKCVTCHQENDSAYRYGR